MSKDYYNLIKSWHIKANNEDYFSKFTFEYLAFIAFITTKKYSEDYISLKKGNNGRVTDRDYIQTLKLDSEYKQMFIDFISENKKGIRDTISELYTYLMEKPLIVDDKWWNNNSYISFVNQEGSGALLSINDYSNTIEFVYILRNNLFHGSKGPEVERDEKLIKFAYIILSFFVENILINDFEKNRFYPFYGHQFLEKFYRGDAEVTSKPDGEGYWADIYEIFLASDSLYPFIIEKDSFTRDEIAEKVKFNLQNLYGVGDNGFNNLMGKIINLAGSDINKQKILDKYLSDYLSIYKKG
jgi:hypothetical protein